MEKFITVSVLIGFAISTIVLIAFLCSFSHAMITILDTISAHLGGISLLQLILDYKKLKN